MNHCYDPPQPFEKALTENGDLADGERDLTLTDRVCPKCYSSLKFDRRNGWVYCSSKTCGYFEGSGVPAAEVKKEVEE